MEGFNGALESRVGASRIGVRDMLSYEPIFIAIAHAGTRRYEN